MTLLDSNAIIDAIKPEHLALREWVEGRDCSVGAITLVEVLGYHRLSDVDERLLLNLFDFLTIWPIDRDVLDEAIRLRRLRKMSLGDRLVAATALVHDFPLVTRNVEDFTWIDGLELIDSSEIS